MEMFEHEKQALQRLAAIVVAMSSAEMVAVARAFTRDHRTLQQNFTRLCVAWLETVAALPGDGPFPDDAIPVEDIDALSPESDEVDAIQRDLSNLVNSQSPSGARRCAAAFADNGPAAQTKFTRLAITWLEVLAEQTRYDLRNEDSVKLGKRFVEAVSDRRQPGVVVAREFVAKVAERYVSFI